MKEIEKIMKEFEFDRVHTESGVIKKHIDDVILTMVENLNTDQLLFVANKLGLNSEYLMPSVEEEWLEFDGILIELISEALCNWLTGEDLNDEEEAKAAAESRDDAL